MSIEVRQTLIGRARRQIAAGNEEAFELLGRLEGVIYLPAEEAKLHSLF